MTSTAACLMPVSSVASFIPLLEARSTTSWELIQGGFDFLACDRPANVPNRMAALPLMNPHRDRRPIFGPFEPHQPEAAISLYLHIQDIALVNPGLLPGLGRDDHLTSAIDNGSHLSSLL
jgi:hypothetical protein